MAKRSPGRTHTRRQWNVDSKEMVDTLLGFIRLHWYFGQHGEVFAKDLT